MYVTGPCNFAYLAPHPPAPSPTRGEGELISREGNGYVGESHAG